ncbi:MAG TPA: dihydrofolate reductase family protein [Thermomicrobiales bacterium]|nr:dihydrofolate reductase family protein [Thermomicrobiales bacterium]
MRKLVAGLFLSLDGVYEAPDQWHFPYFSDEMGATVGEGMANADALMLGRVTYQEFASYWPHYEGEGEEKQFADYLNNVQKYVVSNTLESADWNNSTIINGDVMDEIRKLKETPGQNIAMTGSGTLVRSLLRHGLLDELLLLVHPIAVGEGKKRLFEPDKERLPLKLLDSTTIANGVLKLTYGPADA